jgi:hypothetical protein
MERPGGMFSENAKDFVFVGDQRDGMHIHLLQMEYVARISLAKVPAFEMTVLVKQVMAFLLVHTGVLRLPGKR